MKFNAGQKIRSVDRGGKVPNDRFDQNLSAEEVEE
jgi:hypothetical protein